MSNKKFQYVYDMSIISDPKEPKTFFQATKSVDREKWIKSIRDKIQNFANRESWEYVPREQAKTLGKNIIASKWVYKIKNESQGIVRYKSQFF